MITRPTKRNTEFTIEQREGAQNAVRTIISAGAAMGAPVDYTGGSQDFVLVDRNMLAELIHSLPPSTKGYWGQQFQKICAGEDREDVMYDKIAAIVKRQMIIDTFNRDLALIAEK